MSIQYMYLCASLIDHWLVPLRRDMIGIKGLYNGIWNQPCDTCSLIDLYLNRGSVSYLIWVSNCISTIKYIVADVYVHVYIYICINMYVYVNICKYLYMHIYTYMNIYIYKSYTYMHASMHACIHHPPMHA